MITFLKKFRQDQGISQEFLAEKIGVSRPTYAQIESGARDMSVKKAQKLAHFFGLSLEDFLAGKKTQTQKVELEKFKKVKIKNPEPRVSIPQEKVEKFKEVLLYILERIGARPNVGEAVVCKLMYFIDFDYYEKFEEQLIGAKYIKNHFGPTPIRFKEITDKMIAKGEIEKIRSKHFQYEQKKYLPRRSADLKILSAQEIQHIDEVLARLAWKNAAELSDYSHSDTPWRVHEMGAEISYETVFYRDDDRSVRNYEDDL